MPVPLIGSLGTPELLIILAVLVLLFGATKLPDLARGSGRALRIFKAETKGLIDEDKDDSSPAPGHLEGRDPGEPGPAERERRDHPTD